VRETTNGQATALWGGIGMAVVGVGMLVPQLPFSSPWTTVQCVGSALIAFGGLVSTSACISIFRHKRKPADGSFALPIISLHYIHDKHSKKAHWTLQATGGDAFNISAEPILGIQSEALMETFPHLRQGTDTEVVWRIYRRVISGTNYFGKSNHIQDVLEAENQEATIEKQAKQRTYSFDVKIGYSDGMGRQLETRSRIDWDCASHTGTVVHLHSRPLAAPRSFLSRALRMVGFERDA